MTESKKIALALMAHPDDAEFFCAGTMIRLKKLGWQIHIATMTAGDCGTTLMSADEISKIRIAEATRASETMGAGYDCIGELDGRVTYVKPTIEKVIALFRRVMPMLVFTHPIRDYMMDHEVTASLARSATQIFGSPNASPVPLADGSSTVGIPHLYYSDPLEGIDPFGQPVPPTTVIDIRDELEQKAAALACHASQREWLRAHQGMDEYIDSMRRFSAARGQLIGSPAAEGFVQHRGAAYPRNDWLGELLT